MKFWVERHLNSKDIIDVNPAFDVIIKPYPNCKIHA